MTPIICTSHPADKLKTINAAPVIMVHRHCRELVTGLVASDGASVLHAFTIIDTRVANIQVDLPKKGYFSPFKRLNPCIHSLISVFIFAMGGINISSKRHADEYSANSP